MRPSADTVKPVRLAVVGCGGILRNRTLPALQARDDVRIAALVDPDPASLERARAQGPGHARAFASLDEAAGAGIFLALENEFDSTGTDPTCAARIGGRRF